VADGSRRDDRIPTAATVNRISLSADSTVVHLEGSDSLDAALRRFKKSCRDHGIFEEITRRTFALSRGAKRRAKRVRAAKRRARAARRRLENGADMDWKPQRSG
jgi:ribosomal protein S21